MTHTVTPPAGQPCPAWCLHDHAGDLTPSGHLGSCRGVRQTFVTLAQPLDAAEAHVELAIERYGEEMVAQLSTAEARSLAAMLTRAADTDELGDFQAERL